MPGWPHLAEVTVLSRSVNPWGVYVLLPSIQSVTFVRMGLNGSADALRASQKALPTESTSGLVAFPYGNSRNGIWLCAIYGQQNDALPGTDMDMDYEAHPSGAWHAVDGQGIVSLYLPDGSFLTTNPGGTLPALTRHVVNAAQEQQAQAYPNDTRSAGVASARPLTISLANGVVVGIDVSGDVAITTPGSITITTPLMTIDGDLHVTGAVIGGYGGADQVGLQTHKHDQGADSHGDSEAETTAPVAGT